MKRKLDINSVLGLVIGMALMLISAILSKDATTGVYAVSTQNLTNFVDPLSIVIVFGGTICGLMVCYPLDMFARVPKHLQIVFMPRQYEPMKYITVLVECAKKARINGLLALEEDLGAMDDPFMKQSIQMIVDSVDPEKVNSQMEQWMDSMDERHTADRGFYDKGCALAPAFGMIGTLIGLINMMTSLSDVASVGPNMAIALVTTFYGSILSNLVFGPFANKLGVRNDEEYLCLNLVCEGVKAIQAGENPNAIEEKLLHMLPNYKQKKLAGKMGGDASGGEAEGGKKAKRDKK